MRRHGGLVLLGWVAIACGDEGAAPDAAPALPPDAPLSRIEGTLMRVHITDTDPDIVPIALDDLSIGAWVVDSGGIFSNHRGEGTADGTFAIEDVPELTTLVYLEDLYTEANQRVLDLGYDWSGRAGVQYALPGTSLVLDVDNLRPWQERDSLALFSSNAGIWSYYLEYDAESDPAVGATALESYAVDWEWYPIIDAEQGDQASLYQYEDHALIRFSYSTPIRVMEIAPFTQANGGATAITGSFSEIPQTETFRLNWDPALFTGFRAAVHPDAEPAFMGMVGLYAEPGGIRPGFFTSAPLLVEFFDMWLDTHLQSNLSYGDPFPADWVRFVNATVTFPIEFQVDTSDPAMFFADIVSAVPLGKSESEPLRVAVSPVRDIRVNGTSTFPETSGAGATPTLSWTAPEQGTATAYEITLFRIFETGGATDYEYEKWFTTSRETLTIPPGILDGAERYVFRISAIYMPNTDLTTHPQRFSLPMGFADAYSGIVRPATVPGG